MKESISMNINLNELSNNELILIGNILNRQRKTESKGKSFPFGHNKDDVIEQAPTEAQEPVIKHRKKKSGYLAKKWTKAEDETLKATYGIISIRAIKTQLKVTHGQKRTVAAIYSRAYTLGLPK